MHRQLVGEVRLGRIQRTGVTARIRCGVKGRLQDWEITEHGIACFLPNGNDPRK